MTHQLVARLAFVALFPGYLIYNYGVVIGLWPAFAGGLFGSAVTLFSAFGLTYLIKYSIWRFIQSPLLEVLFTGTLIFMLIWTLIASIFLSGNSYSLPAFQESLYTILIWVVSYFIGVNFNLFNHTNRKTLIVFAMLIVVCVIHAMIINSSALGFFMAFNGGESENEISVTYQGIGRSILLISILLTAIQRSLFTQILVLVSAMLTLLSLGSRAHLFGIISLIVVHVTIFGFSRGQRYAGLVSVFIVGAIGYLFYDFFIETRASEIFNLGSSTSWQRREYELMSAWKIIESNPFFGSFGYHMEGSAGYAHNVLSAWPQYGAIGFILITGMMGYAMVISSFRIFSMQHFDIEWMIAFYLNFIALFLAITSEPIQGSVFPAIAWGFTVRAMKNERH